MFSYPRFALKFSISLTFFFYIFSIPFLNFSSQFLLCIFIQPSHSQLFYIESYSPNNKSIRAKNGGSYLFGFYTLVLFSFTLLFLPFPFHCSLFVSWAHYFCSCLSDVSTPIRQSIHIGTTIFLCNFLRTGHYFLGGICRIVKPVGRNMSFLSPLMVKSVCIC